MIMIVLNYGRGKGKHDDDDDDGGDNNFFLS